MAEVKLITDSSSDLSDDLYYAHDVAVVPFHITFDKKNYFKERVDISVKEFFWKLNDKNIFPSTSLPTAMDYEEVFRPYLKQGMDIVCLCITSKFSGSYQSAVTAVQELKEEFPERNIYAIDSLQASCGQGVTLYQMIKMKQAGYSAAQIVARIEEIKQSSRVIFTLDSLEYLQKGGRIGKVSAFLGTLLQIKPIIIQREGELNPVAKVRGRQKALEKVIAMSMEYVGDKKEDYDYIVFNADCYDEAAPILERFRSLGFKIEIPMQELGITIGCHTGPTVIGICIIKKYDAV